jgi:hypothetical protein
VFESLGWLVPEEEIEHWFMTEARIQGQVSPLSDSQMERWLNSLGLPRAANQHDGQSPTIAALVERDAALVERDAALAMLKNTLTDKDGKIINEPTPGLDHALDAARYAFDGLRPQEEEQATYTSGNLTTLMY